MVAEAQLTNVTRQKFKEAFDIHTAAVIERAEKQILLAQHARHLLTLLDDTPIVPGEERPAFAESEQAREVLNEAESGLRSWTPAYEQIPSNAGNIGTNAMPETAAAPATSAPVSTHPTATAPAATTETGELSSEQQAQALHQAQATAKADTSSIVA